MARHKSYVLLMQFSHLCDSKISYKINTLRKKVERNIVEKPDRRGIVVRVCKSSQIPVYLAQAKGRRSLMVRCSVLELPVRAVDR